MIRISLKEQRSKCLALLLLTIFTCSSIHAQTTLAAGDIAFTGYNSDPAVGSDDYSFVILRSGGVSAGTTIGFTDNGYLLSTSGLATTEGVVSWTVGGFIDQGNEVRIRVMDKNEITFQAFPNPGDKYISLSNGNTEEIRAEVIFFDVQGKQYLQQTCTNINDEALDISGLQAGAYFIKVTEILTGKVSTILFMRN